MEVIPNKIEVLLSSNMLKNAMGVVIPGTDMVGLPIAIALGSLIGKSEYGLEVLKELTLFPVAYKTCTARCLAKALPSSFLKGKLLLSIFYFNMESRSFPSNQALCRKSLFH